MVSRIIAVADAYNAMTSDRPYRPAMVYPAARDRLLQAMGSQFHTDAVVASCRLLADVQRGLSLCPRLRIRVVGE